VSKCGRIDFDRFFAKIVCTLKLININLFADQLTIENIFDKEMAKLHDDIDRTEAKVSEKQKIIMGLIKEVNMLNESRKECEAKLICAKIQTNQDKALISELKQNIHFLESQIKGTWEDLEKHLTLLSLENEELHNYIKRSQQKSRQFAEKIKDKFYRQDREIKYLKNELKQYRNGPKLCIIQ